MALPNQVDRDGIRTVYEQNRRTYFIAVAALVLSIIELVLGLT